MTLACYGYFFFILAFVVVLTGRRGANVRGQPKEGREGAALRLISLPPLGFPLTLLFPDSPSLCWFLPYFIETAAQKKKGGAKQESGVIRKESLRENLKRGERISRKAAPLSHLLWLSLRSAPRAPAEGTTARRVKKN